jgi:hypothetical protein
MRSPKTGNYAFRDHIWISYDDPASVRYKVCVDKILNYAKRTEGLLLYFMFYVKVQVTKNIGGVVAWEINLDDYANLCGCGHFPLLRAANFPDCEVPDCP